MLHDLTPLVETAVDADAVRHLGLFALGTGREARLRELHVIGTALVPAPLRLSSLWYCHGLLLSKTVIRES